jgi:hypothetical protein
MILFESNQIADEVVLLSEAIKNRILDEQSYSGSFEYTGNEHRLYLQKKLNRTVDINKYLFFNILKIRFIIKNYKTDEDIRIHGSNASIHTEFDVVNGVLVVHYGVLNLHLSMLNNQPYPPNFDETIQHEVNHVYQKILIAKSQSFTNPPSKHAFEKWGKTYELAKENINSNNEYIVKLSNLFYYADKGEQDSFANGIYANLKGNKVNRYVAKEWVIGSYQYKVIDYLEDLLKEIKTWNEQNNEIVAAKNLFFSQDTPHKQFIHSLTATLTSSIQRFRKKINGAIYKYITETNPQNEQLMKNFKTMIESPTFNKIIPKIEEVTEYEMIDSSKINYDYFLSEFRCNSKKTYDDFIFESVVYTLPPDIAIEQTKRDNSGIIKYEEVAETPNGNGYYILLGMNEKHQKIIIKSMERFNYYCDKFQKINNEDIILQFYPKYDMEITKLILEDDVTLYHITPLSKLKRIMYMGLVPKEKENAYPNRIYFGTTKEQVIAYSQQPIFTQDIDKKYVLLSVNPKKQNLNNRFYIDPNSDGLAVYTFTFILPQYINIVGCYDNNGNEIDVDLSGIKKNKITDMGTKQNDDKFYKNLSYENRIIPKIEEITEYEIIDTSRINLNSFQPKQELNPKFFPDGEKLIKKVRLRLLEIADDFVDELNLPFAEPKDIHIVGSIAGYNWSKYSDVDLHVIYDFKDIDKRTHFVREYMDSKKTAWNDNKKIKIYGYDVELYVEDVREPAESNGRYSLETNQWIQHPEIPEPITYKRSFIKAKSAKIINLIDKYEEEFKQFSDEGNDGKMLLLVQKCNKLWSKIKGMRKFGIARGSENDPLNIIFKVLRRTERLEKLVNLKNRLYVYNKSLGSVKRKNQWI